MEVYSTALQGGPGADSSGVRLAAPRVPAATMLHDLITSFLVAFAAITPSQFLEKIWEVPLHEMDEGDVRYTAASVKVSDAADPKASHSRSCDSTDRLHHGSLVAPHTAKPRRWGKCDAGRCLDRT